MSNDSERRDRAIVLSVKLACPRCGRGSYQSHGADGTYLECGYRLTLFDRVIVRAFVVREIGAIFLERLRRKVEGA